MKKILLILVILLAANQMNAQLRRDWVNFYDPHNQGGNWGSLGCIFMVLDDDGNAYVCGRNVNYTNGSDINLVKYNTSGQQVWSRTFDSSNPPATILADTPMGMEIDHDNNLLIIANVETISGAVYGTALLIKYSPDGDTLWTRKFRENPSWDNRAEDLVIDNENNVYVALTSCVTTSDYEAVTIKYDKDGNQKWIKKFDVINTIETAESICLDPTETYVYSSCWGTGLQLFKYECTTGNFKWSLPCPSAGGTAIMTTDPSGNVFIAAGFEQPYPNWDDLTLIKITPAGTLSWQKFYTSEGLGRDYPYDLITDQEGNAYLIAQSYLYATPYTQGQPVWTTLKYSPSGDILWKSVYDRPGYIFLHDDAPAKVRFDKNGNILVAGHAEEFSPLGYDYVVMTYDKDNGYLMDALYYYNISGGVDGKNDFINDMEVDKDGNVFVTGALVDSTSNIVYATLKLAPLSNTSTFLAERGHLDKPVLDFMDTFDTLTVNADQYQSGGPVNRIMVTLDSIYHPYVSDLEIYLIHNGLTDTLIYCNGGNGVNYIETILDDSSPLLIETRPAPFSGTFKAMQPMSVFYGADPTGNWILKVHDGKAGNTGTLYGWKLFIQSGNQEGIGTPGGGVTNRLLNQNHPNPISGSTLISWVIPGGKPAHGTLKVYDPMGKEIRILADGEMAPGEHQIGFDATGLPAGVYHYQLQVSGYSESHKMVIMPH